MSGSSNVLFVVLDTVRKDRLTPYGHDRPTTPNLESFASTATTFETAVAPAPWTLPVHASMFTGRYPSEHGADQGSPYLDDVSTLAGLLSAAGYDTACYSANAWISPYTNLTRGFDDHSSFFEVMPDDLLSGPLGRLWQFVNDNDRVRDLAARIVRVGAKIHERLASGERADSKTPAAIDRTRKFVEESTSDQGWFAFVNLMDAHLPYAPPEQYRQQFAPGVDPDDVCQHSKEYNSGARDVDDEEWKSIRGLYDATIAHMDAELGRLFDWLRETGRWEDTTVVVCADHGELHGEHDRYGHEFALYGELIDVPLFVDHPGLEADRRTDLVELLDLYHTILDATGVEAGGADRDAVAFDPTRSLLSGSYREFARADDPDPGQRAVLEHGDADYAFVEYARPVIELRHLEEKAAAAGIDLSEDDPVYSALRAARGEAGKYVHADRAPDEGYRLDRDPGEQSPVDLDDDRVVADARRALDLFDRELGDVRDVSGGDGEALADIDEATRERLRTLGYVD